MKLLGKNHNLKNALLRVNKTSCSIYVRRFVLLNLCLMPLLSGCMTEPLKLTPPLPVPKNLFHPCLIPDYNVRFYGDYPGYVAQLVTAIALCNVQLDGIKKLQDRQ